MVALLISFSVFSQARKQREEAEYEEEQERAAQRAEKLQEELRADAERQQYERELFQKARNRAMSDATEMPPSEEITDLTPIETFQEEIQWQGASFMYVKLFHPQKGSSVILCGIVAGSYAPDRMPRHYLAGGSYHRRPSCGFSSRGFHGYI